MKSVATPIALFLFTLLICIAPISPVLAENEAQEPDPAAITRILDRADRELKRPLKRSEKLDAYFSEVTEYKSWAGDCVKRLEPEEQLIVDQMTALAEPVKGESAEVSKRRKKLAKKQATVKKRLAECRVIVVHSTELINAISNYRQELLKEQLFTKGPDIAALLRDNWAHPALWVDASKKFILNNSGLDKAEATDWVLLVIFVAVTFGLGLRYRKSLTNWEKLHTPGETRTDRFVYALGLTLKRYAPFLLATITNAIVIFYISKDVKPTPFITIVAYGLPLVVLLLAFIHLFLRASFQAQVFDTSVTDTAGRLAYRLKLLALLIFFGYLLFSTILSQSLPESALLLTRAVFGAVLVLNLVWIVWLVTGLTKLGDNVFTRLFFSAILLAALAAELLGYRNLSGYILKTVVGTLISIGLFLLLSGFLRDFLDGFEQGKYNWQQKLRVAFGLKPDRQMPGVIWLRFFVSLLLWIALIASLAVIWQVQQERIELLGEYFLEGFSIGSFSVVPIQILQGVAVLIILLTFNTWIRKRFEQALSKTRMERGARESISTIFSYVGATVAALVALGVAGMEFANLALIAGALSVGIGFGLQNVVNNFVSGLILLFERPVKTGDWIVVGDTEGYVQQISIRSTRIQTFDRADVIVPNSELISGKVTNWMLRNVQGRLRVPVGVAYGSDTAKVHDLLLKVANDHPDVLTGGIIAPEPRALFMAFGDSSLDFELRCFVRDIDRRRTIMSDLNFAIDAEFRKNGVEIPFPQRDVHVRDWPRTDHPPSPLPKKDSKRSRSDSSRDPSRDEDFDDGGLDGDAGDGDAGDGDD